MSKLLKHAREAVGGYSDPELAAMVAGKRLADYKSALRLRNILSMDSPGTYGWILDQDRKNRAILGEIPSFDRLFATQSLQDLPLHDLTGA